MNKEKITDYLIKKLKKVRPIDKRYLKNIDKFNFLSSRHVDSIEILKFNFEVEDKFKISFKPNELLEKNYATIGGLSSLIFKKLSKRLK